MLANSEIGSSKTMSNTTATKNRPITSQAVTHDIAYALRPADRLSFTSRSKGIS